MDLYVEIHRLTASFPANENHLVSPIRSTALLASSNIAEGAADQSRDQFRQFLGYSISSMNEGETQLEAARRVGLVGDLEAAGIAAILDEYSTHLWAEAQFGAQLLNCLLLTAHRSLF